MKNSMVLKAVAIVLAAIALVAAASGAVGMVIMEESGLYNQTIEEIKDERMENVTTDVAYYLATQYIAVNLSNMTENALRYSEFYNGYDYYWAVFNEELGTDGWHYTIFDGGGKNVLQSSSTVSADGTPLQTVEGDYKVYCHELSMGYPMLIHSEEVKENEEEVEDETTFSTTVPAGVIADIPAPEATAAMNIELYADECMRWYNEDTDTYFDYYFQWVDSPSYVVRIDLPKDYCVNDWRGDWQILELLLNIQAYLMPNLLIGLIVFAAAMVYLIAAAGHKQNDEGIRAGGLNRLPLDLYTAGAVTGVVLLVRAGAELLEWVVYQNNGAVNPNSLVLAALPFLGAALLAVGYLFALAAQFKTGGGYWWRNSVIGRCLYFLVRGCRWIWNRGLRLFAMLNTMWQWLVVAAVLCIAQFLVILLSHATSVWVILYILLLIATAVVVCYGAYAFGIILQGAHRMAEGDLNRKISTKFLIGCFAECANQLNALADVAVVAAKNQLKSERMKTELITNVSHDIKTPLTSIINYVDLLQKPHTKDQGEEYLAVLSRQSGRMKKLIEDLMDMSKATTGNMNVEITQMDAVEAVNQALGEFADKLAAVPLVPVMRHPESPVVIRADGRLMWRTLSNLLQNAVKYALPGTRLYVDITRVEGNVVISLKNISREELNISADELMERFVRGDTSRNAEGSGLGLNIAKSLMDLQRGQLRILVDGDLFKTSLIFPAGE